jgi:hypothetical protein
MSLILLYRILKARGILHVGSNGIVILSCLTAGTVNQVPAVAQQSLPVFPKGSWQSVNQRVYGYQQDNRY